MASGVKKWAIVFLGSVTVAAVAVILIVWGTSSAERAAEDFLSAGFQRQYDSSHALMTDALRGDLEPEDVGRIFERGRLTRAQSVQWVTSGIQGLEARLVGVVEDRRGRNSRWLMALGLEGAEWRVEEFRPVDVEVLKRLFPDGSELADMTRDLAGLLADALESGDFGTMYSAMAPRLREQISESALASSYAELGTADRGLKDRIETNTFRLAEPRLTQDETLRVGVSLDEGDEADLLFTFIWENAAWRPVGLKVSKTIFE